MLGPYYWICLWLFQHPSISFQDYFQKCMCMIFFFFLKQGEFSVFLITPRWRRHEGPGGGDSGEGPGTSLFDMNLLKESSWTAPTWCHAPGPGNIYFIFFSFSFEQYKATRGPWTHKLSIFFFQLKAMTRTNAWILDAWHQFACEIIAKWITGIYRKCIKMAKKEGDRAYQSQINQSRNSKDSLNIIQIYLEICCSNIHESQKIRDIQLLDEVSGWT